MFQPTRPPPGKKRRQRLLLAFEALDKAAQEQLTDFAEFLAERYASTTRDDAAAEPKDIPRPAQETVIGAVRRLSETYYMLDKAPMLHETSSLVSAHIMQGRAATDVIDELEQLFEARYHAHLAPPED